MDLIKNLLIDSLNGFSPSMIPFLLFQLIVAALLGHLLQIIMNKKSGDVLLKNSALIAAGIALICAITKFSVPFAIIASALIMVLALKRNMTQAQTLGLFLVGVIGAGCGVGSVVVTVIGFLFIATILIITPIKSED